MYMLQQTYYETGIWKREQICNWMIISNSAWTLLLYVLRYEFLSSRWQTDRQSESWHIWSPHATCMHMWAQKQIDAYHGSQLDQSTHWVRKESIYNLDMSTPFLSPPVRMHGRLKWNAFCLSVTGPKVTPARSAVGVQWAFSAPTVGHCTCTACHLKWAL